MSALPQDEPPEVLVVSRVFKPESAAASFRLTALVRALADRGRRVDVITAAEPLRMSGPAALNGPLWRRVHVHRAPVLRDAAGYVRGYLPYLSFDAPLVLRLLLSRRPEVVVVEPPPTTGAVVRAVTMLRSSTGAPVPYVYYAADIWSDAAASTGAPDVVVRVLRALESWALRGADRVIAVSDGVAERAAALGGRDVRVVPNGVDTDTFTPDGPPADDAPDGPFLLYAGTASEWQGAEVFARAMRRVLERVPDARLVYLGQGSSYEEIAGLARALPDGAVTLLPVVTADRAAAWHRAARGALVGVRPGIGYDFAYPTKVLAALACGTPVLLAGPGPAASDLREHDLGLVTDHDVEQVAEAMVRLLTAPAPGTDPDEQRRRADWVRDHRSIAATGRAAADVVLDETAPRP